MEVTQTKPNSFGLSLFFRMLYREIMEIYDFLLDVHYFLRFPIHFVSHKWKIRTYSDKTLNPEPQNQHCISHEYPINHDLKLCSGDAKKVMDKLGVLCHYEHDGFHEIGEEEFSNLFEVEPSLEELKEAFDVFDINRDGFIDPTELQRVLSILGLKEGSNVERCRRMISGFDDNGDGLIDFHEFVKFMEKFFC